MQFSQIFKMNWEKELHFFFSFDENGNFFFSQNFSSVCEMEKK